MKLNDIARKVAADLMPPGTLVERMREDTLSLKIGSLAVVEEHFSNIFSIKGKSACTTFFPEYFRVVKEAEQ